MTFSFRVALLNRVAGDDIHPLNIRREVSCKTLTADFLWDLEGGRQHGGLEGERITQGLS